MIHRNRVALAVMLVLAAAGAILFLRGDGGSAAAAVAAAAGGDADVVVYKSPTCGCCNGWIEHLEDAGYTVAAIDIAAYDELAGRKRDLGVPGDLGSCHTAVVEGYTVEGHVPAEVIARLIRERPAIRGLAVPGMPIGSPGMEGPNPQPYDVIAIGRDGSRRVYESVYPGRATSDTR